MQTKDVLDMMERTKTDEEMFFRLAHIFCFGVDANVATDVAQFKLNAIVPVYVLRYVNHILETDI
jgi:hypothetical protein